MFGLFFCYNFVQKTDDLYVNISEMKPNTQWWCRDTPQTACTGRISERLWQPLSFRWHRTLSGNHMRVAADEWGVTQVYWVGISCVLWPMSGVWCKNTEWESHAYCSRWVGSGARNKILWSCFCCLIRMCIFPLMILALRSSYNRHAKTNLCINSLFQG